MAEVLRETAERLLTERAQSRSVAQRVRTLLRYERDLAEVNVDRIARRVVELLGDRAVRDVAWEVIPDMAEVIIRDRLRELEGQVE